MAQATSRGITPPETRQVNEIARRFSERFRQTKDIAPITRELFVSDFVERSIKTEYSLWLFLDPKFARTLPKQDLQETYALLSNWMYLSSLYVYSRHPSTSGAEIADSELLPIEVSKLIRQNKGVFADSKIEVFEEDGKEWVVDSELELRSMKSTLTTALPLLRKAAIKRRAGMTRAWKETMSDFGTRFKYYDPWVIECRGDCHGFPEGTMLFVVNAELFQLNVVKIGKRMRILSAYYYFD
jgi:hypothetical protein